MAGVASRRAMERAGTHRAQYRGVRAEQYVRTCRSAWTPLTRFADSTVIPGSVRARVSIRTVPDQEVDVIAVTLQAHLESTFRIMGSPNCLVVNVDLKADWRLGSLADPWFKAVEPAVRDEWDVEPLRICEVGVRCPIFPT
jgi:acetylornithine deacetylase/succinyl-diaminopimelate desuccinylase-like protein